MFAQAAVAIYAVIKALPAARDIFVRVQDMFYADLSRRDEGNVNENAKKRDALVASLKQPGLTEEQRDEIRNLLFNLQSN